VTGPALLADPRFVLEEQADALAAAPGLFLKAACAAGSFSGWLGRPFCRESPNSRKIRPIEVTCRLLANRFLQIRTKSSRVKAESPLASGSGPASTMRMSSAFSLASSFGGRPSRGRSASPSSPYSL